MQSAILVLLLVAPLAPAKEAIGVGGEPRDRWGLDDPPEFGLARCDARPWQRPRGHGPSRFSMNSISSLDPGGLGNGAYPSLA